MKLIIIIALIIAMLDSGCKDPVNGKGVIIGAGQMPSLARDDQNNLHVVYGSGDSMMYSFSVNDGKMFSSPSLISVVPKLAASHMRGPQIAATSKGLIVMACNTSGDIYSYVEEKNGNWKHAGKINDADTVAKEGLIALAADGPNACAVWLDLRGDRHNKIFGARSNDGGRSWSKNFLIYASPDNTVCECCKPTVAIKGNNVYVMFRNWLNGNRDLYLVHSSDGGNTFEPAQKLGEGSWKLDGCPMDGGGLVIKEDGNVETVWKRRDGIYSCEPGKNEKKIGEGRNCAMESVNGKNVYAWTSNGQVVVLKPEGTKEKLGQGSLPIIKAINNKQIICVWENDKQIRATAVDL
ncbi:MAG TPA: sialidase family protein [Chitinophagaceae bacterium]|nr:sialidase family protein [Chitinophagaceae bacterium]